MKGIVTLLINEETLVDILRDYLDGQVFANAVGYCDIASMTYLDDGGIALSAIFGDDSTTEDASALGILHDLAFADVGTEEDDSELGEKDRLGEVA
jgi:hypothetical protein